MSDVMSIVPCCLVHESLVLSGHIEPIHYCAFCIRNQRDEIQKTLETVEREVALVYCEITGGKISKCNTDAQTVIAVANDHTSEEAKKDGGNEALDFLRKLTTEHGAIMCSSDCSELEIAEARNCGRFLVDPETSCGYVMF